MVSGSRKQEALKAFQEEIGTGASKGAARGPGRLTKGLFRSGTRCKVALIRSQHIAGMRALIVEGDGVVARDVSQILQRNRWTVDWTSTANSAWPALRNERFDAIFLGIGRSDDEALGLLRRLRMTRPNTLPRPDTPTLVMTAREQVASRSRALDAEADGCLITPVGSEQLDAWLRDIRRLASPDGVVLRRGRLEVEPDACLVYLDQQLVDVHAREFRLLVALLESSPRVRSRSWLEACLYGREAAVDGNAVEVLVHRLRKKLGEGLIQTARGQGYFIAK